MQQHCYCLFGPLLAYVGSILLCSTHTHAVRGVFVPCSSNQDSNAEFIYIYTSVLLGIYSKLYIIHHRCNLNGYTFDIIINTYVTCGYGFSSSLIVCIFICIQNFFLCIIYRTGAKMFGIQFRCHRRLNVTLGKYAMRWYFVQKFQEWCIMNYCNVVFWNACLYIVNSMFGFKLHMSCV